MFTKEEEKQIRFDFWSELNDQLDQVRGVNGNKVNWTNFNTHIRHLYFRMEADQQGTRLCIDLQFPDESIRSLFYEQFTEFEQKLSDHFGDLLIWTPRFDHTNGKEIARIAISLDGPNLFKREDWPAMHTFLVDNFKKLERFWSDFSEIFVQLKK